MAELLHEPPTTWPDEWGFVRPADANAFVIDDINSAVGDATLYTKFSDATFTFGLIDGGFAFPRVAPDERAETSFFVGIPATFFENLLLETFAASATAGFRHLYYPDYTGVPPEIPEDFTVEETLRFVRFFAGATKPTDRSPWPTDHAARVAVFNQIGTQDRQRVDVVRLSSYLTIVYMLMHEIAHGVGRHVSIRTNPTVVFDDWYLLETLADLDAVRWFEATMWVRTDQASKAFLEDQLPARMRPLMVEMFRGHATGRLAGYGITLAILLGSDTAPENHLYLTPLKRIVLLLRFMFDLCVEHEMEKDHGSNVQHKEAKLGFLKGIQEALRTYAMTGRTFENEEIVESILRITSPCIMCGAVESSVVNLWTEFDDLIERKLGGVRVPGKMVQVGNPESYLAAVKRRAEVSGA